MIPTTAAFPIAVRFCNSSTLNALRSIYRANASVDAQQDVAHAWPTGTRESIYVEHLRPPGNMRLPGRKRTIGPRTNFFLALLGAYVVGLVVYGVLLWRSVVPDSLGAIESLGRSQYGVWTGAFSIGYVSIAAVVVLAALSADGARADRKLTLAGAGAMLLVGLVVGASFAAFSLSAQPRGWLHSVQDSQQGFTLTVYYNSTTLDLGTNLTMRYTLTDNSYAVTTPYYMFGGQFSMVFNNSNDERVVAFRAPVSFKTSASTDLVELAPGESWTTYLGWNGTVFSANGTRSVAPAGSYMLGSYVALQDANVTPSLYVVLHPPVIPVTIS